jgi:DNA-binding CsgD family transcriptional regulator
MDVILRTLDGERVFPDVSPSVELKDMFSDDISPRQMTILRRFVRGMTYDEIAEELGITPSGVRWNLAQLIEKGGFGNKHELFIAVVSNKLVVTELLDEENE